MANGDVSRHDGGSLALPVTWIRGPWWDGFWILSGLPVGLALLFLPPQALLAFFTLVVALETAHSFSPIVLAWSHSDFRRRCVLARPAKFILMPGIILVVAIGVGAITSLGWTSLVPGPGRVWILTDWTNPFPAIVWVYWLWNIYHFGMQNFGVASLYGLGRNRRLRMAVCLAGTAFGMAALPAITQSYQVGLICLGAFSFSHWMTALGLCSTVSARPFLFLTGMLALGGIGFVWMVPTSHGNLIRVVPVIVCARIGLGLVHFLYDRWLWRFGDADVRATIGYSLGLAAR